MTTTEQFLRYLADRARHNRNEPTPYWTYAAWRWIRGYSNQHIKMGPIPDQFRDLDK